MKKQIFVLASLAASVAASAVAAGDATDATHAPRPARVALVVQDHTTGAVTLPVAAVADTLTAALSGREIRVVSAGNAVGTRQNRRPDGEALPESSAASLGWLLDADGVLTASILEFTSESIGVPAVAYALKVRLTLNLADAATGETVCGVEAPVFSRNYTAEQAQEDNDSLFEGLMHSAASDAARAFLAKFGGMEWRPAKADFVHVNFTCNVPGADAKIDGVAFGTVPALVRVPKGVHNLSVECRECEPYSVQAFFTEGQTYNVVLHLDAEGLKRHRNETLFAETLERMRRTGGTDDYVRKTLADGTAQYWKNSGVKIEKGDAKEVKLNPPGGGDSVAPSAPTVGELLEKAGAL